MIDRKNNRAAHAWVEDRLSNYMDNQLPALERAQLERHLRDCTLCQQRLAALQWTVSLLKQAPTPKLPHSFTLPVPARTALPPIFGLNALRLATVLATLVLVSLLGVDLILNLGGSTMAPAPMPAARNAQSVPPTSVALVPQPTPTNSASNFSAPAAGALPTAAPPTAAPLPTQAPRPTSAPAATSARAAATVAPSPTSTGSRPLAQPFAGTRTTATPTPNFGRGGGGPPETSANKGVQDTTEAATAATVEPPRPPVAPVVATPTAVPPTATGVPPTPTPLPKIVVQVEPTRQPAAPPPASQEFQEPLTPLRIAELATLFVTVFLGAVTLLLLRKK